MHIICVNSFKGGTGKTTSTLNLSAALSEMGYSVLMIDLDVQCALTYSLGCQSATYCVMDLLLGHTTYPQTAEDVYFAHLLPAKYEMASHEFSLQNIPNHPFLLKNALERLDGYHYDFVLIDTSPFLHSPLVLNAYVAADYLLITSQMEVLALNTLGNMMARIEEVNQIRDKPLELVGILPTMYNGSRKVTSQILDVLNNQWHLPVFDQYIRTDVKVVESPSYAQSVVGYDAQCKASQDYRKAAQELLQKLKN